MQEYWSGLPFLTPEDLPDSGIEPVSPALACRFFAIKPSGKLKGSQKTFKMINAVPQGHEGRRFQLHLNNLLNSYQCFSNGHSFTLINVCTLRKFSYQK